MKKLENARLIGQGFKRYCYEDPDNEQRCIKVSIASSRENDKEEKYYKALQKRNISWDMMARLYEKVDTDKGSGLVFDLFRDFNGEVSKQLAFYLLDESNILLINKPKEAFENFRTYLMDNRIFGKDLNSTNILYQRNSQSSGKFVFVDGSGNTEAIPISTYIDFFAKKKINQYWSRFQVRLSQLESEHNHLKGFLEANDMYKYQEEKH